MNERDRIEQALTFDTGCEPSAQEIIDALNRAGYQITPQSGAEPYLQQWAKHSKEAIQSAAAYYQHKSDRAAPPRPVCPHLRSSDEGTQWCNLAASVGDLSPSAGKAEPFGFYSEETDTFFLREYTPVIPANTLLLYRTPQPPVAPVWQDKERVYAWLGYWRDKFPADAVTQLQDILGPLALPDSPGAEKP